MFDLRIINGTLVDSNGRYDADIYVRDGKIAAIEKSGTIHDAANEINACGRFVLPGLIDTHVHSRDGGALHKEDFFHSTMSAASGGITTIFEMPNSIPATVDVESFNAQVENYSSKALVDFCIWALCVGYLNNDKLEALSKAGAVAFKFFWGYAIKKDTYGLIYNYDPEDKNVIAPYKDGDVYEIFESVAKTGKPIAIHAENADLIATLTKRMVERGAESYDDLLKARPNVAEETVVSTALGFARETGAKLHVLHVSSGGSVPLIRNAKSSGTDVTFETCPHYLFLSNEDFPKIGNAMKIYPPVKYKRDSELLWRAVDDNEVLNICSDHAPHTPEEKSGKLWDIPAGACGVETGVPLMLNAINENRLTLERLAELMSENPAKRFGLYPQKGSLQIGTDADFTIVDMDKEFTIKNELLHSVAKVSPYDGMKVKGMPVATIVRGNVVMNEGVIDETVKGKFVKA